MLWCLDTLLKESFDGKIDTSIWFHCMKKKSLMEDTVKGAEVPHLSEPQKAHLTGEFVVVA